MFDFDQLRFVRQSPGQALSGFSCGNEDLDRFLFDDSVSYDDARVAVTYLCFCGDELVGYVTLAADSIRLDESERAKFMENKARLHEFPAGKIARLAVKNVARAGLGLATDQGIPG